MNFPAFLLVLLALSRPIMAADAAASPACNDEGKIYKICGDQTAAYAGKLDAARKGEKMLVVVLGAEWCPWCLSLHHILEDKSFGKGFAKSYVLADVGMYDGKVKVPSGESILDQLKTQAHYTKKIDGIPVLAVVNPDTGKARLIDTEPLERNTKTTKGHDPKKVLAALKAAENELR